MNAASGQHTRIFIPRDVAALAVGAEAVYRAFADALLQRGVSARIVRTGSRGLFWLEPLVEVETGAGRIAYGPVAPADVPAVLDAMLDDVTRGWRQTPAAHRPS